MTTHALLRQVILFGAVALGYMASGCINNGTDCRHSSDCSANGICTNGNCRLGNTDDNDQYSQFTGINGSETEPDATDSPTADLPGTDTVDTQTSEIEIIDMDAVDTQTRDTGTGTEMTDTDTSSDTGIASRATICIDPGWITDTENSRQLHELALINRKVAYYLTDMFAADNFRVVMTVPRGDMNELYAMVTNDGIDDEYQYFKAVSLQDRADVCNTSNADYFISIHHNTLADTVTNYTRVYYATKVAETWGDTTHNELEKVMRTVPRNDGVGAYGNGGKYFILDEVTMPGILTVASFYTNTEEKERLNNNEYLQNEAHAIYTAFTASH
ncbi:MAG: N-acetylmuramoyl-L-alanine amidase [Deltaproteobacteria bacterium]|nr:N-acetylmuramoyl-L-alanine amidase [Deltaproteobacteria bacterium]